MTTMVPSTAAPLLLAAAAAACLLAACCVSGAAAAAEETTGSAERHLLGALGLSGRPRPARGARDRRRVPTALWRMFRRSEGVRGQEGDPCTVSEYGVRGNIVRHVQDQGQLFPGSSRSCDACLSQRLYFNVSVLQAAELLSLARLEIKFHGTPLGAAELLRGPQALSVSLYKVVRATLKGANPEANRRLLLSRTVHLGAEPASVDVDLTSLAENWRKPGRNYGLALEMLPLRVEAEELLPFLPGTSLPFGAAFGPPPVRATLVTVSLDAQRCRSRQRRSVIETPVAPSNLCKARRLYLDFKDVGWQDWVIAPQGYMANYCHGECPFPLGETLNGTNHAILQTLVHSLDPRGTPQPCCVPIRFSPVSMLYYDNNDNVVLRHYEDMAVDECGCR